MPTISYAVTACNEHTELDRLIKQLISIADKDDEIVIQTDQDNVTDEVLEVVRNHQSAHPSSIRSLSFPLNKNFADFKNNLKNHCKNSYIFFIDADEYLSNDLSELVKELLVLNPEFDCFALPRINTVEGLTYEHVQRWRWQVNEKGWVNFPDYQLRICKNVKEISWVGPVHEVLMGHKSMTTLPCDSETNFALMHPKTIARQEKQNALYETI